MCTNRRIIFQVCHDETASVTYYTESYIDGDKISQGMMEPGNPRPSFRDDHFYTFQVKQAYEKANQTLAILVCDSQNTMQ